MFADLGHGWILRRAQGATQNDIADRDPESHSQPRRLNIQAMPPATSSITAHTAG